MIGVTDPYVAFCVDEAVFTFGSQVEKVVSDARTSGKGSAKQKDAKADNALRRMLGVEQKFRDPMATREAPDRPPKPWKD